MVALNDSNLVPRFPSRAHPRVQGSIFATKHQTVHQGPSLTRSVSHFQALQGKSTSSPKRLHRVDHSNQQFSILALTDSSGAVVERVAYQTYGQPTFTNAAGTTLSSSAKATRYSYTGREWDSSLELLYFRSRWMSGVSGRFINRDKIGYGKGALNLHMFLENDPLKLLDPIGLEPPEGDMTLEQYLDWWFDYTIYPTLNVSEIEIQKARDILKRQLLQGCIGVVGTNVGHVTGNDWTQQMSCCYKDFPAAKDAASKLNCCKGNGKNIEGRMPQGRIVWVQFSNDQGTRIPFNNGCYDLSSDRVWREINSPVGGRRGNPNFDFKVWMEEFMAWLGANHGGDGMILSLCKDLDKEIEKGEKGGLELNFYCPMCETEFVDDGKGGVKKFGDSGKGGVK